MRSSSVPDSPGQRSPFRDAIPRLLARHHLTFDDIALWEIHGAFAAQVLCHVRALEDRDFVHAKAGVEHTFGRFPRERVNPNG